MINFPLFLLAVGWLLYKLFSEKPCPLGHRYDSEKARQDLANGIGTCEWQRRKKKGYYWSTPEEIEQRQKAKEDIPGVVDIKRYEYDKKLWGEEKAEQRRAAGHYKHIIEIKGL